MGEQEEIRNDEKNTEGNVVYLFELEIMRPSRSHKTLLFLPDLVLQLCYRPTPSSLVPPSSILKIISLSILIIEFSSLNPHGGFQFPLESS